MGSGRVMGDEELPQRLWKVSFDMPAQIEKLASAVAVRDSRALSSKRTRSKTLGKFGSMRSEVAHDMEWRAGEDEKNSGIDAQLASSSRLCGSLKKTW